MRRYVAKPCLECGVERLMRIDRQICQICVRKAARAKARERMQRMRGRRKAMPWLKRESETEAMKGACYD